MASLPAPRALLSDLLSSVPPRPARDGTLSSNPLHDADPKTKSLLLTLHVLYANEFLAALDLLDRRLIARFVVRGTTQSAERAHAPEPAQRLSPDHPGPNPADTFPSLPLASTNSDPNPSIYFVRSAQPPPKRFDSASSSSRFYDALLTHYEVRPMAWNCSCPAFAFAAFPATDVSSSSAFQPPDNASPASLGGPADLGFGGLSRLRGQELPPVCKHLLACVLVERCALFAPYADVREVSLDELGGWCAGWGG